MQISLIDTGKRFNREWIFRHLNYEFLPGESYAITGANGSGKSTLLQVIAGGILHSEGQINLRNNSCSVPAELQYRDMCIAAPYLELVEELTATELLHFHRKFKALTSLIPDILAQVSLQSAANKQIRYFSSGMKQRLKLAQAFFSKGDVLLLDEPLTNLDAEGIDVYNRLIKNLEPHRTVIVSSNDEKEYSFCRNRLSVADYK